MIPDTRTRLRRSALIQTKVSPAERDRWHRAATSAELTVSEMVRLAVRAYLATLDQPSRQGPPILA